MKKVAFSLFLLPLFAFAINFQKMSQVVVFIANESNPFEFTYGANPGYYTYFRPVYEYLWPTQYSHGSGFIVSPEGHIITNAHVVEDGTSFLVALRMDEIKVYKAKVVGKDLRSDLAVLKLETNEEEPLFPVAILGDSDALQVGERVICIGNPLYDCLEDTVTVGVVSGTDRSSFGEDAIEGYIQTDAAMNSGNSGGPIFNSKGEVIGVCCWGLAGHGVEGMKFAIPVNIAKQVSKQIIATGKISQGFLGVKLGKNEENLFGVYHFERNEGAWIKTVLKGSPAEKCGLKEGDFILGLNERPVISSYNFKNQLAVLEAGSTVQLIIVRDGEIFETEVTLGEDELSEKYSALKGSSIVL